MPSYPNLKSSNLGIFLGFLGRSLHSKNSGPCGFVFGEVDAEINPLLYVGGLCDWLLVPSYPNLKSSNLRIFLGFLGRSLHFKNSGPCGFEILGLNPEINP